MELMDRKPSKEQCFKIRPISKSEATAIKEVADGIADGYAQRLALQTIVTKLCRTYDVDFIPQCERQSAFLAGRGYVGKQIYRLLKIDINQLPDGVDR